MISLLSPRVALNLLLSKIKSELGTDFDQCDIVVDLEKKTINLHIDGVTHLMENEALQMVFLEFG